MQTAFVQKMGVPIKAFGLAKPSRRSQHIVMAVNGAERNEANDPLKAIAIAGLAALLVGTESPAFAATVPKSTGQGEVLEQLLAQQKAGNIKAKTITAVTKPADVAVYKKNKPNSASKPVVAKPRSAAKPAAKKPPVQQKAATKPLKFDTKAGSGTQGAAPAGVDLPVPKGATKSPVKPVGAKKAVTPTKAAAKPVAAKASPSLNSTTAKPLAAKAAPAPAPAPKVAVTKAATRAAATATAAKVATSSAPALKATAAPSSSAISNSIDNGAIQAGAVLAAELAGLAIASSIVGQITRPSKA